MRIRSFSPVALLPAALLLGAGAGVLSLAHPPKSKRTPPAAIVRAPPAPPTMIARDVPPPEETIAPQPPPPSAAPTNAIAPAPAPASAYAPGFALAPVFAPAPTAAPAPAVDPSWKTGCEPEMDRACTIVGIREPLPLHSPGR